MYTIGTLEEVVLLLVMIMEDEAYGVSIANRYNAQYDKNISIPAIHTVLSRLEKKGFLDAKYGGVSPERGGRRKKIYAITPMGYKILKEVQESRQDLWSLVKKPNFSTI